MELQPSDIRYSQDSIANYFGGGSYRGQQIGLTLDELVSGRTSVYGIPRITVTRKDGAWYTSDNRRLWVFKKAEELGVIDTVHVRHGLIDSDKFTTKNKGMSVRVRGDPGGYLWRRKERNNFDWLDTYADRPNVYNFNYGRSNASIGYERSPNTHAMSGVSHNSSASTRTAEYIQKPKVTLNAPETSYSERSDQWWCVIL